MYVCCMLTFSLKEDIYKFIYIYFKNKQEENNTSLSLNGNYFSGKGLDYPLFCP